MRTGQRESKFVFKTPHTTPTFIRDFGKVTCADEARSLRHKGLRFIFCDLPIGDKMILQGRITMVGDWKARQKTAAVFALRQFFHFRLSNSWCNILGNDTSYYQISERWWTHHVPVDFNVVQHYDNLKKKKSVLQCLLYHLMAQLLVSQFMLCNGKTGFWDKVLTKAGLSFTSHEALEFHNFCIFSHYRVTGHTHTHTGGDRTRRLSWSTNRLNELPEIHIFSALLKQENMTFLRQSFLTP